MRTTSLRGVMFAAAALFSNQSFARPVETVSIEVRYSDLDLSTSRGVQRLHMRAQRAIIEACGSASDVRYVQLVKLVDACQASAKTLLAREMLMLVDRARAQQVSASGAPPIRVSAAFAR
jgi:UrcA family protein